MIIATLVVGVISLIGIVIFSSIYDALPSISNTALDSTASGLAGGFASAMDLIPVVMLVMIAMLVIATVARMGTLQQR